MRILSPYTKYLFRVSKKKSVVSDYKLGSDCYFACQKLLQKYADQYNKTFCSQSLHTCFVLQTVVL